MRCRKVRSLLSAACSDELGGRQLAAVREHLVSCPSCRKESAYYSSIGQATREMPREALSDDFNTRLLNRIAQERFAETRTRAYLPKPAPRFRWRLLAPMAMTAALVTVVAVNLYVPKQPMMQVMPTSEVPSYINDSYLTAQPTNNPNFTVGLEKNWTLDQHLARMEKLEQISRRLTSSCGFGVQHLTSGTLARGQVQPPAIGIFFQRSQPVFRIYQVNGGTGGREDGQAY